MSFESVVGSLLLAALSGGDYASSPAAVIAPRRETKHVNCLA